MRFNSISIRNMRLIGKDPLRVKFDHDKNVVILLGDNGLGKTTILDAMATAMAPFPAQFPGVQDYQLSELDVHINERGRRSGYLEVKSWIECEDELVRSFRYRKGTASAPKSNYEELKRIAFKKRESILGGENDVQLPVFAYYGTGRGQFKVPERKRGFQRTFERWDCYKSAINPETDFKRFFGWYDLMEDEERRERQRRRDFDYQSPVLQAVRTALSEFVPSCKNPRIETRPLRFVMDKVNEDGSCQELRIEQMSDGYKIVIAMVADLAARMAEANPDMENPLQTTGIVLIDEVDLHLHPKWQREIIAQLSSVFSNIQFIVTTHSPVIVIGAVGIAQLVNLNNLDSMASNEHDEELYGEDMDDLLTDMTKSDIGSVLLSSFFELPTLQSPQWDESIRERDRLLSKTELSKHDAERLQALDRELEGLSSLPSSSSVRSDVLMEKLARQLNIKL